MCVNKESFKMLVKLKLSVFLKNFLEFLVANVKL